MKKYNCDICLKQDEETGQLEETEQSYFGFNSTYGYCDKPECKKTAIEKLKADIMEQLETDRIDIAMELAGDEDPSLLF